MCRQGGRRATGHRATPKSKFAKLKVPELWELLNERGLDNKGKKAELVERLEEDDRDQKDSDETERMMKVREVL